MLDFCAECLKTYGEILKGEKAHLCPDWDFLPIDENCDEFEACLCSFRKMISTYFLSPKEPEPK